MTGPEYNKALFDIEEALKGGLRAFAAYCAEHWRMDERDRKEDNFSLDYMKGWNAAIVEAVDAALDAFLDEHSR